MVLSDVQKGLNTKFIGREIYYLQRCSSTMDIAKQLNNPVEGTLILAEAQTKGRGRFGRHWVSPKYKGLYFSLILKPKILPAQTAVLTLLAAVSICEAVKAVTGITCSIKWPNDILLNNRKLAGILTELNRFNKLNFVIIGIGLNVNNEARELLRAAISLKAASSAGRNFSRLGLLREILRKIEDNYLFFQKKSAGFILDKWRSFNITLGQRIKITLAQVVIEGQAMDIDADGGLLVREDNGVLRKFMSGDVVHLKYA